MSDNTIEIRRAIPTDLIALQALARRTFEESYAWYNTAENMKYYLEHHFSLKKLEQEINSPHSRFYLLYKNNLLSGYIKFNLGIDRLGLKDDTAMEIERIYVLKDLHGTGMGQALCDKAIHEARQNHLKTIWLGVWENNSKAISFYSKNKFVTVGTHPFKFGNDHQTDFVMELNLTD